MVKDTAYYDLLGVPTDVNDTDLKKAYRKKAIQYHPDKNKSADAEEVFKDISKAYQILSDPNSRATYDKNGKEMVEKMGMGEQDPAAFFAAVFGGERFYDLIGEISLMKEMSSVADVMMTEEERAELEKEAATATGTATPTATAASTTPPSTDTASAGPSAASTVDSQLVPHSGTSTPGPAATTPTGDAEKKTDHAVDKKDAHLDKKGKQRLTPEQRKKLEELEANRKKAMEERVSTLSKKLIERIRPFVDAKNPDDKNDPEVKAYIEKTTREAEDLKLESFGVELLHSIGNIYMMKATSALKSRKLLGIPGFFSRLKEKGAAVKEAWGLITSAVGVQAVMEDMARRQEKGEEFPEEELRAMEQDLTGKILLASWRGTRFEVSQVLREVCDRVLKDPEVTEEVLVKRAKAILITGAVFKSAQADESAEEQRELERLVARAAGKDKPKKHHKEPHTPLHPTATPEATTPTAEKTEGQRSWFSRKNI